MVDAMLAWNTDYHFVYIDIAGTGPARRRGRAAGQDRRLDRARRRRPRHRCDAPDRAERASRTCSGTSACSRGEVGRPDDVAGDHRPRDRGRELPARAGDAASGRRSSTSASASSSGQPVGQIHFLERPDREPAVVSARQRRHRLRRPRDRDDRPGRQRRRDRARDRRGGARLSLSARESHASTSRRRSGCRSAAGRRGAASREGAREPLVAQALVALGRRAHRGDRRRSTSSSPAATSRTRCARARQAADRDPAGGACSCTRATTTARRASRAARASPGCRTCPGSRRYAAVLADLRRRRRLRRVAAAASRRASARRSTHAPGLSVNRVAPRAARRRLGDA